MRKKKRKTHGRKVRNCSKLSLLPTEAEQPDHSTLFHGFGRTEAEMSKGRQERGCENKPKLRERRRVRLYALLTDSEAEELDRAAAESGAGSRNLLITEALKAGVLTPNLNVSQEKRRRSIEAWIPHVTARDFKLLAANNSVTQAHLLRHLLRQYLANAPWKADYEREQKTEEAPTA
jgi:hypothetical protein